jgi:hypothetical protein
VLLNETNHILWILRVYVCVYVSLYVRMLVWVRRVRG